MGSPCLFVLFSGDFDGVFFYLLDDFHEALLFGGVEQLKNALWFVKGWPGQFADIFHVAVLHDVIDDFFHEDNLRLGEGLVVDEFGKGRHGRFPVHFGDFSHQQPKRRVLKGPAVIFRRAQLAGEDALQTFVIGLC